MGNDGTTDKTLELLGLTRDELREKVIEKAVDHMLDSRNDDVDEDGYRKDMLSTILGKLTEHSTERIDQTISDLAEKHILPNVAQYIENLTVRKTNQWGEAKGKEFTFIEYLISRGETYLTEEVDSQGKTKAEDSYNWRGAQSRITYLIHEHLQYSINKAVTDALKTVNDVLGEGISETIKIQLAEIVEKLKVGVRTR